MKNANDFCEPFAFFLCYSLKAVQDLFIRERYSYEKENFDFNRFK